MFTTDKPTKKLFRKLDKKVPGFSYLFDPKKIFDLNKNQSDLLEVEVVLFKFLMKIFIMLKT